MIGSAISQISESVGASVKGSRIARRRVRHQQHVRLGDPLPAADRRAVEAQAVVEGGLVESPDRQRHVLPRPEQVAELQVDHLRAWSRAPTRAPRGRQARSPARSRGSASSLRPTCSLLPTRDHKKRAQDSLSPEAPLPRRPPSAADDLDGTLAATSGPRSSAICQDRAVNIWADEWDATDDWSGGGAKSKRLVGQRPAARRKPLRARPGQLRRLPLPPRLGGAPDRAARAADVARPRRRAATRRGRSRALPARARTARTVCATSTDELVRYVVAGIRVSPEVAEYPDVKKITAQARTDSQTGERLWLIHDARARFR